MAVGTTTASDWLVLALRGRKVLFNVVVTLEAEQALRLGSDARIGACMWVVAGEAITVLEGAVDGRARRGLHEVFVTLDAQGTVDGLEQTAFVRTVSGMTAYAVSSPHGSMRVGLRELALELDVTGVAKEVRPVEQDAGRIGAVRIMAFGAALLLERRVQIAEVLGRRFGLFVTRKTESTVGGVEQGGIGGGVGGVTGETTLLALDGLMLVGRLHGCVVVTFEAQLVTGRCKQESVLGGVWVMAGEAVALLEWSVFQGGVPSQVAGVVTAEAEFSLRVPGLKGVGVGWSVVA